MLPFVISPSTRAFIRVVVVFVAKYGKEKITSSPLVPTNVNIRIADKKFPPFFTYHLATSSLVKILVSVP